jgi:hypothetical protein
MQDCSKQKFSRHRFAQGFSENMKIRVTRDVKICRTWTNIGLKQLKILTEF